MLVNKDSFFGKLMRRIGINHLRLISNFSDRPRCKTSEWEKFLTEHVSLPTARKIIRELVELDIVRVERSLEDRRVKLLTVLDSDIERFL
jgi:DNA-binding MarR family transcriptional regulator